MRATSAPKAQIWTRTDPWLTARLSDMVTIRRGDVAITNAIMNAMALWLHAAGQAIYGHRTPDVLRADVGDSGTVPPNESGVLPDLSLWPAGTTWTGLIDDVVIPEISKLFGEAFNKATRDADLNPAHYRQAYVSLVSDRLSTNLWTDGVFEDVRDVIATGVAKGDSITEITKNLGPVLDPGHYEWQARRIARTETMGAVNAGTWNGAAAYAEITGESMFKQWYATRDTRTREDHAKAHRQVVPLDGQFNVGGWSLSYPGDPDGPADQVINCRCTFLTLSASEAEHYTDPDAWEDNPAQINTLIQEEPAVTETLVAAAPAAPDTTDPNAPDDQTTPLEPAHDVGTWSGMLVTFDTPSGDGRIVAAPAGEMRVRPMPLPLLYQDALDTSHKGAVRVGLITDVQQTPAGIWGAGTFNMNDPRAADIADQLAAGQLGWVSVDLDDTTSEFQETGPDDGMEVCSDWRLMGATLVSYQAFPDAKIVTGGGVAAAAGIPITGIRVDAAAGDTVAFGVLSANTGLPVAPATTTWDGPGAASRVATWAAKGDGIDAAKYARAFLYRDGDPGNVGSYKLGYADVIGGDLKIVPKGVYAVAGALGGGRTPLKVPDADMAGLKAAAGRLYSRLSSALNDPTIKAPWKASADDVWSLAAAGDVATFAPPMTWFDDPALTGYTPLTVTDDGQIFGHLAPWDVCHIGIREECRTAPRSNSGYAYFHLGSVRTAEGSDVAVGTITLGTDHAGGRASLADAQRHYADTGMAAAVVRAGEDEYGIWVSGAVLPGADLVTLRRAPLSGDWRTIGGSLELVGALAVNTPGFPVPRMRWHQAEPGRIYSLTAAGASAPAPTAAGDPDDVVEEFAGRVAASIRRHQRESAERDARMDAAVARVRQARQQREAAARAARFDVACSKVRDVRTAAALRRLQAILDTREGTH